MRIKICGVVHEIIYEGHPDFTSWGSIDHIKCKIKLRKDLNSQCQATAFIEEIIHGILVHTGFQGKHNETLIGSIANGLYQAGITMESFEIMETPPAEDE